MAGFNIEELGNQCGLTAEQIRKKIMEFCTTRPGFFTPFNAGRDMGTTLAIPFIVLGLGTITPLLAAASAIAGAVCIASLVTAGIAAAAGRTEARNASLTVAAISGIITVVAPLISAIATILAVIATAVALFYLLTRTGASIGTSIHSCFSRTKIEDAELDEDQTAPAFMAP